MNFIKSSKHTTKFNNTTKQINLNTFVNEYRRVLGLILDDVWNNGYTWTTTNKTTNETTNHEFNVKENKLEHPKFMDYNKFNVKTPLSARALSFITTQLCSILGASVEKQRKRLFVLNKLQSEDTPNYKLDKLKVKIKQNKPTKPDVSKTNLELSSKCCDYKETSGEFNGFLRLKYTGLPEIKIPIKYHRQSNKWKNKGRIMTSFLVNPNFICIRWKCNQPNKKTKGEVHGADQGIKTCLSLSDGQATGQDIHGWDLDLISKKKARKRKGSIAYRKVQDHYKNYIHWCINRVDLKGIKELRLENIVNIRYKQRTSRYLQGFVNSLVRDTIKARCEENGVHFKLQSSTYRSQRCSQCGWVQKSNRKGKVFSCNQCGYTDDADINASLNHKANLPDVPVWLRKAQFNRTGFYWLETGFVDEFGVELRVPLSLNSKEKRVV